MSSEKPWYLSRTIWAALIVVAASGGGLVGVSIDGAEQTLLADAVLQAVAAIAGIVAIVGRIAAKNRIG
ncbi:hypothetical protein [Mesorhizobium sp. KR1-2]|uniref:hypothetical protein n=1 Tax=Mesorhizobium sp. KR1-2 TaxID=3156609 RepID=UPI0032B3B81F